MGRKKHGEGLEQLMINIMVEQCVRSMASSGSGLLRFIEDVTEAEVDWEALHSTKGQRPKTYSKSNPGIFVVKQVEYSEVVKSISWFQPDRAAFHSLKTKLKTERATNKRQLQ